MRKPILKSYALFAIAALLILSFGCNQETETPSLAETSSDSQSKSVPADVLPAAPDFTLPAANKGTEISLSQFQGDKPVVLVFYRAYW